MRRSIAGCTLILFGALACGERPATEAAITALTPATSRQEMPSRSPDGRQVAYWLLGPGGFELWVADADFSNPRKLPATYATFPGPAMWSPDGRELLVGTSERSGSDVILIEVESAAVTWLTDSPAVELPIGFHPDGDRILFGAFSAGGTARTYTISRSSREVRPYPESDGSVVIASVSPDGSHLAFMEVMGGLATMWVSRADGGGREQLTQSGYETFSGLLATAWSPDSREFLFTTSESGRSDVMVGHIDGSVRQLTSDINDDDIPVWSPDGKWVAFRSNRGRQGDVWVVPASGGEAIRVTNTVEQEEFIRWTGPTTIEFTVGRTPGKLWRRNLRDGSEQGLTDDSLNIDGFWVSRDRSRMAVTIARPGGDNDLAVLDLATGGTRIISQRSRHNSLRWSRDGSRMIFEHDRSGSTDVGIANVTGDPQVRTLVDWPSFDLPAGFSAGGDSILVVSDRESNYGDLWQFPLSGGAPTRVTSLGTVAEGIVLNRSAEDILMLTMMDSASGEIVAAERLAGGGIRRLASGNPAIPIGSPDGRLFATEIPRGGSAVVMRRDGTRLRELEPGTEAQDFSFDNTHLLFTARRTGNSELYLLDLLTGASTRVTQTPEDEVDANYLDDSTIVLHRVVRSSQLMRAELGPLLEGRQ